MNKVRFRYYLGTNSSCLQPLNWYYFKNCIIIYIILTFFYFREIKIYEDFALSAKFPLPFLLSPLFPSLTTNSSLQQYKSSKLNQHNQYDSYSKQVEHIALLVQLCCQLILVNLPPYRLCTLWNGFDSAFL